jgi:hypothetical protein
MKKPIMIVINMLSLPIMMMVYVGNAIIQAMKDLYDLRKSL